MAHHLTPAQRILLAPAAAHSSRAKTTNRIARTEPARRAALGRTGICYVNAVSESFFATYKKELIHTRPWPTIKHLDEETFDWIETYYNTQRRHSTLGYLTPREYELGYREISEIAA